MPLPVTTIDVFSDVVCPWCYLGKHRLAQAIALVKDREVVVRWHPFRLDPTIPPEGIDRDVYLTRKFGSVAAVDASHQRIAEMGKALGIAYRFDLIRRLPDTTDAHRLTRWAAADGLQDAMVERLFAAYFAEGRDIGDRTVLVELATEVGLSGDIAARLASDADREAINAEIAEAQRIGVNAVPCFVIDRRLGVMGAQTPDVLVSAIRQSAAMPAVA
jgi:predicted DsbA family dithiol-disulfide isomerase